MEFKKFTISDGNFPEKKKGEDQERELSDFEKSLTEEQKEVLGRAFGAGIIYGTPENLLPCVKKEEHKKRLTDLINELAEVESKNAITSADTSEKIKKKKEIISQMSEIMDEAFDESD